MLVPTLLSRIEKTNFAVILWVNRVCFGVFEIVTNAARQPEIFFIIGAARRFRQNMFDFKRNRHEVLRILTVAAAIFSRLNYLFAEFGGNSRLISNQQAN